MDEETRRRAAMRDDAVSADAKHATGHLLVRRNPATGISLPAELREGCVEASREGRQQYLVVEVSDSLLLPCCHQAPPA